MSAAARGLDIPPGLLEDIKAQMDITWQDEGTDRKVRELALSGMAYLDLKRGSPADYTVHGLPRTLLMEYVRYGRDAALDVFETNYLSLIVAMRNEGLVDGYVQGGGQAGLSGDEGEKGPEGITALQLGSGTAIQSV